jgi:hypothetical protein
MDATQILETLEKQKNLLEHFIGLSKEHLLLWEAGDLAGREPVLQRRAFLMSELAMMSATVSTRIRQIHANPLAAWPTPDEVRQLNDDIVTVATHIMDIDEDLRKDPQRLWAN